MATTKELLALLRFLGDMPTKKKKNLLSFLLALQDSEDTAEPPVFYLPTVKK